MTGNAFQTFLEMFRDAPVETSLYTLGPLTVAAVQLSNSVVNGLSFLVSVPFAVVLVGFAAVAASHRLSQFRLAKLEPEPIARPSD